LRKQFQQIQQIENIDFAILAHIGAGSFILSTGEDAQQIQQIKNVDFAILVDITPLELGQQLEIHFRLHPTYRPDVFCRHHRPPLLVVGSLEKIKKSSSGLHGLLLPSGMMVLVRGKKPLFKKPARFLILPPENWSPVENRSKHGGREFAIVSYLSILRYSFEIVKIFTK